MKYQFITLTAILNLLMLHTSIAQYTSVPDPNFEQKIIDIGKDDVIDGQIVTDSALWVWTLDLQNSNISDLTGIEAFININTLNVQGNNLTSLDLTSNGELRWLNCYDNQLTSLNLSGLTHLIAINCKNNQITPTIDVSSSPDLTHLYCWSNQIKCLDLSNNPNLVLLHAFTNNLGYDDPNCLNIKNGNNTNIPTDNFNVKWNWNVLNILVDDTTYSKTNWTNYHPEHMKYVASYTLPIEFGEFTGNIIGQKIKLHWTTWTETNNLGFEIQRSPDGISWKTLAWIPGKGNSMEKINYSFEDTRPSTGKNYYRLLQKDFDGETSISKTIFVDFNGEAHFSVGPNPFSDVIQLLAPSKNSLDITVSDITGVVVFEGVVPPGFIDLSFLSSGCYYLREKNQNKTMILFKN